jgi:hypothetical protein
MSKVISDLTALPLCRLCGKNVWQIGGYLHRVNKLGEDPLWECRPSCTAEMPFEIAVLKMLEEKKPE